jgi:spore germination cell wall hydrolase CwlJ-like protein
MLDLTDDLQVLTATLWGEARGEPVEGQKAVASVIVNRAKYVKTHHYPMFGDGTIKAACLFPWQFSSWNQKDPNRAKMLSLNLVMPDTVTSSLMDIAEDAMSGNLPDNTGAALWYKTTALPWPHVWGEPVAPLCVIGHQSFYNLLQP